MALKGIEVNGVEYPMDSDYLTNRQVTQGTVTIGTSWTGSGPWSQTVTIQGATARTKVDLQPDATTLEQLVSDGVTAIWVENDNGTLTAKTIGAAPTAQLSMQCTLTRI